ncbi:hypothetical protein I7I48_01500 [Histoplasma ohiense]|nr:hypothetical protein I7I48_01500 [Histoplasma ohiense (nom. inval.)]
MLADRSRTKPLPLVGPTPQVFCWCRNHRRCSSRGCSGKGVCAEPAGPRLALLLSFPLLQLSAAARCSM